MTFSSGNNLGHPSVGMSLKLNELPICGRDDELKTLNRLFNEAESRGTVIAVQGKAGCGKSALIESQRASWLTMHNGGCLFASSRFDDSRSEPFSGIIDAVIDLIDQLLVKDEEEAIKYIKTFKPKVCQDLNLLCTAVPKLFKIYQNQFEEEQHSNYKKNKPSSSTLSSRASYQLPGLVDNKNMGDIRRVTYQLLSHLCQPSKRRIVLFFDDIDCADTLSLDFLNSIAEDAKGFEGLLLISSYGKVDLVGKDNHPATKSLSLFEQSTTWNFHKIHVQDFDQNTVNHIVSKVTKRDLDDIIPLSEVMYRKTGGNSFVLLQFLQLLVDEKLLYYSFTSLKWEWVDLTTIERSMNVSDDVADIIVSKSMSKFDAEILQVLMVASCCGSEIPISVLTEYTTMMSHSHQSSLSSSSTANTEEDNKEEELDLNILFMLTMDSNRIKQILESCLEAGILGQRHVSKPYSWLHDKLQVAAYSMIPDDDTRGKIHFGLGDCLSTMIESSNKEEWMIYMAADQYNKALALRNGTTYSVNIAELNLRAAQLSISRSAFYPAVEMLRAGLRYIDEKSRWKKRNNYDLTLNIYSTLAETDLVIGNNDEAMVAVNEVLAKAQTREDKFRAQQVQLKCVISGSNRDYGKAIGIALDILDEYDEHLPRKPNKVHIFFANQRLKSFLPEGRIDKMLEMQSAMNENGTIVEQLLGFIAYNALYSPHGSKLAKLAVIHSLCVSCKHGVSGAAARAIVCLGLLLKNKGKIREACDHVELAIDLCNKFKDSIPEATRVWITAISHGGILPEIRPFHESLEAHLSTTHGAYGVGDMEIGCMSCVGYCLSYFCMGLPLAPITRDLISFANDVYQLRLPYALQALFHICRQTLLNLQEGKSVPDVTVLKGEAMDQDEMLNRLEGPAKSMTLRDLNTFRLILACIFRDLDVTSTMMEELSDVPVGKDVFYARNYIRMTFMGLAAFVLARKRNSKKHLSKGKEILKTLKSKLKQGSMNAHPLVLMLEAEECPSRDGYDIAISSCARSGLVHYQAYMYESAAMYLYELEDEGWGEFYLRKALELYSDWGASRKVDAMKTEFEFLKSSKCRNVISSSFRGRRRHSVVKQTLISFQKFRIGF